MKKKENRENSLSEGRALEDYFTEKGLRTSTGLPKERWNAVLFKELLENSLDALKEESQREITLTYDEESREFFISDTGKGLQAQDLEEIYNFHTYASSKRWIRQVSRGSLGNALKTVIGICFLKNYSLEWRFKEGFCFSCVLNEVQKKSRNPFF
jgi:K+-sensing histidine kinase KdpD